MQMADYENEEAPPDLPEHESREPIWSVPSGWGRPCFFAFCVLTIGITTFLTWYDLLLTPAVGSWDIVAAIIRNIFPAGGAAAVSVIILAEGLQYTMSTLDYLRNKWVKPLIEKHRAEGRAEVYEQLREWLERREAAERAGLPFDEPLPSPDDRSPDDRR